VLQRQAAQAKLKELQLNMHDVQAQVQALKVQAQDDMRQMPEIQKKISQYSYDSAKARQELSSSGFNQEVRVDRLEQVPTTWARNQRH